MKFTIDTKAGQFTIDTARIPAANKDVMLVTKARHMLKNEVDSHMLSWRKSHPTGNAKVEHGDAIARMIERMYNGDMTLKAAGTRLSPVDAKLRDLLAVECQTRAKANGGSALRGDALKAAMEWVKANDSATMDALRATATKAVEGVDKIIRDTTAKDIAALMAKPKKAA